MTFYRVPYGFILHAGPYTLALMPTPAEMWNLYLHADTTGCTLHIGPLTWTYSTGRMPF